MLNQKMIRSNTEKLLIQLQQEQPRLIYSARTNAFGITIRVAANKLRALAFFLRNSSRLQFRMLVDIAAVDKLQTHGRFAVNYLFLSMKTNQRLTVQLFAAEESRIPSLTGRFANGQRLFASAA